MPPASRFTTSKFKNAQLRNPGRSELIRGQLPFSASTASTSASAVNSTFSSELKTNTEWVVTVAPTGELSFRSEGLSDETGTAKVGSGGGVGDWDLSRLDDGVVAVGGLDGKVTIYQLLLSASETLQPLRTINLDDPISHVLLHPTTPSIMLLSSSKGATQVYNLFSDETVVLRQNSSKAMWDLCWSPCGRFVACIGKDGVLSIWEPRKSTEAILTKQMSLMQPLKPARVEWVKDTLFLTSFSRSRDRQYTLHSTDPSRNLETLAQQTMDQNTSVLKTAVDQERGIVYASGRGDMTLRQIELQEPSGFIETVHPLSAPLASSSLALAHASTLPVMQAQIGTLLLPIVDKDGDAIQPTAVKVPRRQLIDYHEELFPDIRGDEPQQTAAEWWAGGDAAPASWTLDPARRQTWEKQLAERRTASKPQHACASAAKQFTPAPAPASSPAPASFNSFPAQDLAQAPLQVRSSVPVSNDAVHATRATKPAETPKETLGPDAVLASEDHNSSESAKQSNSPSANSTQPLTGSGSTVTSALDAKIVTQQEPEQKPMIAEALKAETQEIGCPTSKVSSAEPLGHRLETVSAPTQRFNPNWSRKFLGAKAALIPSYNELPPLSSLHPDSMLLQTSMHHLFFPIAGPGGRLAVHPRKAKGRMPVGGRGYLSGGVEMAGFAVDPFADRVAIAGEDGAVRVWSITSDGFEGGGPEPDLTLKGKNVDRITQVAFHPTSQDFLVVATNDLGRAHLRFWDLAAGDESLVVAVEAEGIHNCIFSTSGDKVAIATKDRRILVLNPRSKAVAFGKAHDSPRSFQLAWIDEHHLVSAGFSTGSQRKIQLYRVTDTEIQTIESVTIDVSPSVLFPVYDPDTSILYIWGRGERGIQAYQIDVAEGAKERIVKLPAYTGPNAQLGVWFSSKTEVDVRKVEIGKCWRLTAKTIEEVTFSIPRNKPDFFQDDVFVPTLDTQHAAQTAADWLAGRSASLRLVDLKPSDLKPLSEAPKPQASNKPKFIPGAQVMSEEERKRQEMEELFKKAKMDLSDSESEEETGVPAPDDDW